jgi:hypothetical protein
VENDTALREKHRRNDERNILNWYQLQKIVPVATRRAQRIGKG